jgi:DHA1 family bicyclomycin/chloramphenicol resistance-like MFS transporter
MEKSLKLDAKSLVFIHSTLFIVLLGSLTAFDPLSIDMYLPAFQKIQAELHTSYSMVELSLSSFFIGMSLGQLVYGPLADRFGRKIPLLGGMLIYMLATFACAFSPNIETLIVLRMFQAFGGCAGMVITRAIVRDVFDSKKMANFFSSLSLVMGLAPILAPTIGGFIISISNWRVIFYLLGSLNAICFFAILFFMPETHLNRLKEIKFKQILKTYFELLTDKRFIGYTLPDSFIRAGMFAYIAGSPFVFMELYHIPSKYYGWIFGFNALGLISASQFNRVLIKKFDSDQILRMIRPITTVAAIVLFTLPFLTHSIFGVILPLFCFLFTLGVVGPNSGALVLAHQGNRAGMASALYGTIQWGTAILTSFLVSYLHNGTIIPMTGVILGCALISLFGFQILIGKQKFN